MSLKNILLIKKACPRSICRTRKSLNCDWPCFSKRLLYKSHVTLVQMYCKQAFTNKMPWRQTSKVIFHSHIEISFGSGTLTSALLNGTCSQPPQSSSSSRDKERKPGRIMTALFQCYSFPWYSTALLDHSHNPSTQSHSK